MTIYGTDLTVTTNPRNHYPGRRAAADLLAVRTDRVVVDGVAVVRVAGEIDAATAPRLAEEVDGIVDVGVAGLVLDLRAVTFLGIAGLITLADLVDSAGHRDVTCRVVTGTRAVDRALEVGDPTGRLPLAADVAAAVNQCATGRLQPRGAERGRRPDDDPTGSSESRVYRDCA